METIGKYRIQKILGRGGMGTVYEALDPLINRKVAIKTMIPGLAANAELRERFLREAQAAGGLRHRNIVTVYDFGEDNDQPYIAMEFIEGTDLEHLIANREPVSLEWKLDVIRQICEGLAYAHKAGIVHRDIKPANIRVTTDGEVKIMDFGIAHLQSSTMTRSGLVLGTVHYMAPEQIVGQKVDHRADIFAVGAIAYELISGRKPFDGESLTAVMYKVMHERPDPSALPATSYSPGLDAIILKAMAREVHERYQTLEEMHSDLGRLVRDMIARLERSDPAAPLLQEARDERAAGHVEAALRIAREALKVAPAHPDASLLATELEEEERRARATRLVEAGQQLLSEGEPNKALEHANQAMAVVKGEAAALVLARKAEAEILGKRVEREMSEIRAQMERARAEGQLQMALSLCRKLLELNPEDAELKRLTEEIETAIKDKEVEQLCGIALSYVAEGDTALAIKIASKIERLAPQNPRFLELRTYLDEEAGRRTAEALTATARDHLALGNLTEARAAAEEAVEACPTHVAARDIRDRVSAILSVQERAAAMAPAVETPAPKADVETPFPPPAFPPLPLPLRPADEPPAPPLVPPPPKGALPPPTARTDRTPTPLPFAAPPRTDRTPTPLPFSSPPRMDRTPTPLPFTGPALDKPSTSPPPPAAKPAPTPPPLKPAPLPLPPAAKPAPLPAVPPSLKPAPLPTISPPPAKPAMLPQPPWPVAKPTPTPLPLPPIAPRPAPLPLVPPPLPKVPPTARTPVPGTVSSRTPLPGTVRPPVFPSSSSSAGDARRPLPTPAPVAPAPTPKSPLTAIPFPPRPTPPAVPSATPVSAAATAPPPLPPLQEGNPTTPEAVALVEGARMLLRERQFQKALPPLEKALQMEPGHPGIDRLLKQARIDARKAEVEALTTAALNHFVQNDYAKARKAVDKALALDPDNKKAKQLMNILGALG